MNDFLIWTGLPLGSIGLICFIYAIGFHDGRKFQSKGDH